MFANTYVSEVYSQSLAQILNDVCLLNADRIFLLLAHFTIIKLPTHLLTVIMFQLHVLLTM